MDYYNKEFDYGNKTDYGKEAGGSSGIHNS